MYLEFSSYAPLDRTLGSVRLLRHDVVQVQLAMSLHLTLHGTRTANRCDAATTRSKVPNAAASAQI